MTITDFRLDYSSELHSHYLTLGDFDTAEDYIAECCNMSTGTILDFAGQYGAKAAKELIKFYEKGYRNTIEVTPILAKVNAKNVAEEILLTIDEPTFIAMNVKHEGLNYSAVLDALLFSIKKPKKESNRYEIALNSARIFELLLRGEITIEWFKERIDELNPKCECGEALNWEPIVGKFILNSRDNRFEQLIGDNPNSYWHHISFTDFQDDCNSDPSEDECRLIEIEIEQIGERIQALFPEDKEVSRLWDQALDYAKLIQKVMLQKISVAVFIDTINHMNPELEIGQHIQVDPDRHLNLIIKGDRFSSILRDSNSLWAFLTDTDFDLSDDIVIPSKEEIETIDNIISSIGVGLKCI